MKKYLFFAFFIIIVNLFRCSEQKKSEVYTKQQNTLNDKLISDNSYTKIKIDQYKSGHLTVNVKVNKVKGRFIIDTGSSSTIIDYKNRKRFRLKTESSEKIGKTAGGVQLKMKVSNNNVFEFGEYKLRNVKVSLANLGHINNSFEQMGMLSVDGIIGSDILIGKKGIIDYETLTLYLKKQED